MGAMASQTTSLTIVYSTVCSGTDKKTSKLRVTGLCEGISPHKGPVARKMLPFEDVIMKMGHHIAGNWFITLLKFAHSQLAPLLLPEMG